MKATLLKILLCNAICFLIISPQKAYPETVSSMVIEATPSFNIDKSGKYTSCGVAFRSAGADPYLSDNFIVYQGSININNIGDDVFGSVKLIATKMSLHSQDKGKKSIPIQSFWLKSDGVSATTPEDGKYRDSDTPGGKYYFSGLENTAKLLLASINGEAITIGLNSQQQKIAHYGSVEMSKSDRDRVNRCLSELFQSD